MKHNSLHIFPATEPSSVPPGEAKRQQQVHGAVHSTPLNEEEVCRRAGILPGILSQAIDQAKTKCRSCQSTGAPLPQEQLSFSMLDRRFNTLVAADFLFHQSNSHIPVLLCISRYTRPLAASPRVTRDMDKTTSNSEQFWIHNHGPPQNVTCDDEFNKEPWRVMLARHDIECQETPVRRKNKTGGVERAVPTVKVMMDRLLRDRAVAHHNLNTGVSDSSGFCHLVIRAI